MAAGPELIHGSVEPRDLRPCPPGPGLRHLAVDRAAPDRRVALHPASGKAHRLSGTSDLDDLDALHARPFLVVGILADRHQALDLSDLRLPHPLHRRALSALQPALSRQSRGICRLRGLLLFPQALVLRPLRAHLRVRLRRHASEGRRISRLVRPRISDPRPTYIAISIVAMFTENRKFHWTFAILNLVYQVSFATRLFMTLT